MDDEDFLSELGITSKTKPSPNNGASTAGSKTVQSTPVQTSKATPAASGRGAAGAMIIETDIGKRKKKAQQKQTGQDDMKWLSSSPRDGPSELAAKTAKGLPLALQEDGTSFEPLAPHDRFNQYVNAFEVDESDFGVNLAEEQPFLTLLKKKMKPEDAAVRFIASWKRACGGNIGDAKMTPRAASFLSGLVLYHDPKLWAFLADQGFDYAVPSLFEFYAPVDPSLNPILELWDASIMNNLAGFETPTQGSLMFALALFLINRDAIMQESADLRGFVSRLRVSTDPINAIVVGCRAAKLTPDYFVRLVGEIELDWNEYDKMLAGESKRSPASPPLTSLQKQHSAPTLQRQNSADAAMAAAAPTGSTPTAAQAATAFSSWVGQIRTSTSQITTASLKESFTQLSQKVSDALQGTIDDDDDAPSSSSRRHQVRRRASTGDSRHLFLVEYPGVRRLGLQLGQSTSGLTVVGFDRTQSKGEAEMEGTVQVGDTMHSVNWVSVAVLPASIAGKVLSKQERPLHITFSTMNPVGRKLPLGLSVEARAVQHSLLRTRLLSFYERFGQDKVDEVVSILRIYAKHEKALVRGLYCKYGEPVPGDGSFASELVLLSAAEALTGGLAREDEADADDLVFVDVRTPQERADTGMLPSTFCLSFDDKDEAVIKSINRAVASKQNKTKVCLLVSGTHRMFSLVDPARAAEEKGKDRQRLIKAARKLAASGLNCICAIRGGFTECFREAALRQMPLLPGVQLKECGNGFIYRACDAYSMVEYRDTESLGRFIVGYFTDFKDPVLPANGAAAETQPGAGNGVNGAASLPAAPALGRNVSQEAIQQNLQAALKTLPSLPSVSLFKPTAAGAKPGGGDSARKEDQPAAQAPQIVFSIDDD